VKSIIGLRQAPTDFGLQSVRFFLSYQNIPIVPTLHVEINASKMVELLLVGYFLLMFCLLPNSPKCDVGRWCIPIPKVNLGWYISVSKFWQDPLFSSKKGGHWTPFGALSPPFEGKTASRKFSKKVLPEMPKKSSHQILQYKKY
jgi:hypothetical protein